ncbi:MAG: hypothetical protein HOP29_13525 [Phycisphaerales bacterium]|nr:hypothetical protein [Phycisphaerales bacterium]
MGELTVVIVLYAVAVLLLTAEFFIPSHGVLTVVGVVFLVLAIVRTFQFGRAAGIVSIVASLILLPTFVVIAVKMWPRTRMGRLIAPPNPVYTAEDLGAPTAELEPLLGSRGRTLSAMRPVGLCEFDGRRLQCVCESGMLDAGVAVTALRIKGRNLEVAAVGPMTTV